jgi:hypothetical protein
VDPWRGDRHDPQSLHKYAYVHANPVNGVDPTGALFSLLELEIVQWIRSKLSAAYYASMAFVVTKIWVPLAHAVNAFNLKFSETIANYERSYYSSRLLIQEIIRGGTVTQDPGGVWSAVRYVAPGTMNGSPGVYELVVDIKTQTILHFLFKSG